jgi:hypothetical protein
MTPIHEPGHSNALEQNIAVAVVLWIMVAGIAVVVAHAWALEWISA